MADPELAGTELAGTELAGTELAGPETADPDPADPEPAHRQSGDPQSADQNGVILLVEDDEVDRELYGRLLWYNGYGVLHAADGESAVALALKARPDIILLDMMIEGEMTGIDVAVRLRQEGLEVPMIALSAVKREQFGAAIDEAGIAAYLEKPVDPFAVVREVLRHVGGSRADER